MSHAFGRITQAQSDLGAAPNTRQRVPRTYRALFDSPWEYYTVEGLWGVLIRLPTDANAKTRAAALKALKRHKPQKDPPYNTLTLEPRVWSPAVARTKSYPRGRHQTGAADWQLMTLRALEHAYQHAGDARAWPKSHVYSWHLYEYTPNRGLVYVYDRRNLLPTVDQQLQEQARRWAAEDAAEGVD